MNDGQRSVAQELTYSLSRQAARMVGVAAFGIRVSGRSHFPVAGGGLICANHQSYFDPVLVGLACDRRLNYLARRSLFRFAPFRWLIQWYDAIPIEREGLGMSGLKETLKRLKRGELVLIFPEGTRTRDGQLQPLKSGFCLLARRARVPLVPVGLDGAYQAWPRNAPLPRRSRIALHVGRPIAAEQFAGWSDEQLVEQLHRAMGEALAGARRLRTSHPRPLSHGPDHGRR